MNYKIDCHGLSHAQAKTKVEEALLLASAKGSFTMDIVTGQSTAMQVVIKEQVLEEWDFNYYMPANNLGIIKVTYTAL